MKKTYLVTGATGFVGSGIVKKLVQEGHNVIGLDNNSRGATSKLGKYIDEIEFVEADIRDTATVSKAAKKADAILHLAYINGTEFFYEIPEIILDVGVRGMLSVMDACKENDIGELILASSSEVYQTPPSVPTPEDVRLIVPDVMNPRYSYGGGKIISELLLVNYARKHLDRAIIFRPHNVYGPNMGWEHVLPQFALRAQQQIQSTDTHEIPFQIQGDGKQTRSFIYIDDFSNGLLTVLEKGKHLNVYNIGTEDIITIRNVAEKVVNCLGRQAKIITGEEAKGGTNTRCPDISKLRSLGFKPSVSLDEGIQNTVNWYIEHADEQPRKN